MESAGFCIETKAYPGPGRREQSERARLAIAQASGAVRAGPAVAVTLQSSARERVSLQWLCMTLLGELHPKHCACVLT